MCAVIAGAAERIAFRDGDVAAFIGGADVAAAQHSGHAESILAVKYPSLRFRNFGWEGDTVFAQPRDFNFPSLIEHLRRADATVVFVQFGRMEIFAESGVERFRPAYEKLLNDLVAASLRIILVTPVPFERAEKPLPDLSRRNAELKSISKDIREIARERNLPVIDLFQVLSARKEPLTEDGLQLTARGHAFAALAMAQELGHRTPEGLTNEGGWTDPHLEKVRRLVIEKNQFWFDYWRPQNWAFLGGDRVEQPSSRDHRDPKVRWFPAEMERFQTLIAVKEQEIAKLTGK